MEDHFIQKDFRFIHDLILLGITKRKGTPVYSLEYILKVSFKDAPTNQMNEGFLYLMITG